MSEETKLPNIQLPCHGAKYMLERGFKLLPIVPNGKRPLVDNWPEVSKQITVGTVDSTFDNRNWAVHPGLSGHIVVDLDNKNGKSGSDTWAALQRQHGEAPRTFTVETPTGGYHLYFCYTGEAPNTAGAVGVGIDTRGLNGYALAPGSEIDGKAYRITDAGPVAYAPGWLVALAQPKAAAALVRPAVAELDVDSEIARAVDYLKSAEPCVEGQGGNNRLYTVCCAVRDFGVTLETAIELLVLHFNHRCAPPWSAEELQTTATNSYNYAQNSLGAKTVEAATASAVEDFTAAPAPEIKNITPAVWGRPITLEETFGEDAYFLFIEGEGVVERGDVAVLQAKTKSGKSSAIAAMMASLISSGDAGRDFLGWRGSNPGGAYVLHFDTEQKPKDSQALLKRTLAMAGLDNHPSWFVTTNLKGYTKTERRHAVENQIKHYANLGTVLAVFLDGIGDLCDDTNDKEASERLGEKTVRWTQAYGCAVITVLHENPSAESQKMRGHLGTYMEMKAEAVFRLAKDEKGVFTLWAEKMRRGYIAKGSGPTWIWSKDAGRPVSTISVREVKELESSKALNSEREECAAFLIATLPAIGDKRPASELNEIAVELKHGFARKGQAARFVDAVKKLVGDDAGGFKFYKTNGATSPWIVERCVIVAPDAAAMTVAALTS